MNFAVLCHATFATYIVYHHMLLADANSDWLILSPHCRAKTSAIADTNIYTAHYAAAYSCLFLMPN